MHIGRWYNQGITWVMRMHQAELRAEGTLLVRYAKFRMEYSNYDWH